MKLFRNPFIGEGLSACFSHPLVLRTYTYYLAVAASFTFFWWPRNPLATYLQSGVGPQTFMVASLGLFISLVYLNIRYGTDDYIPEGAMSVKDFVTRTPVPIARLIAGKTVAGALHALFLLLLGLPFLLVSRNVSGAPPAAVARFLLVMGCSSLAYRSFGFLMLALMGAHSVLKQVFLLCGTFVLMTVVMTFFPQGSALSAILDLEAGVPKTAPVPLIGTIPDYLISVMMSLIAAVVLSAASFVWLRHVRWQFKVLAVPGARRDGE